MDTSSIVKQAPEFELPRIDQRVVIVGRTGSGKTQLGTWLLSEAPFDRMPFVIFDYKYDGLLNASPRIKEIQIGDRAPREPGLYIVHPMPDDDDGVDDLLMDIWANENTGVYFDETYMIPDKKPFRAIMTQGRSKRIPAIALSQRPAWISKFAFTESEHIVIFRLQHRDDQERVERFVPDDTGLNLRDRLPKYHSRWYSIDADHVWTLKPVPTADVLAARIDERLKALEPVRRWF